MDHRQSRRFLGRLAPPWLGPRPTKLWHRLAISFGLLLALMLVLVGVAVLQFRVLAGHNERMLQQDFKRMRLVQGVYQHAQGHGSAMARLLTSSRHEREAIYPVADAEYVLIEGVLDELGRGPPDPGARALLATVALRREQYREAFIEVVTAIEGGDLSAASALFNGAGLKALNRLLTSSEALLAHEVAGLEHRQAGARMQMASAERTLGLLALVAVALSALMAWRTTLSVAKPLERVVSGVQAISQGDYSARISVRGSDEVARVAHAFNGMAQAVSAREREIEQLAFTPGASRSDEGFCRPSLGRCPVSRPKSSSVQR